MVALLVTLDVLEISKLKLNFNEYLTLLKIQHNLEGSPFPFVEDERFIPSLIEKQFIQKSEDGYILGEKGIKLFEGEDLFEEFYKTFPHKVETEFGFRPLSTLDPQSESAKATRAIWLRKTKNKAELQRRIITNLKRELEHRKRTNSLKYLQNIDTWIRDSTWEKWEDIPDNKNSTGYIKL
jgi:hypothetical protein